MDQSNVRRCVCTLTLNVFLLSLHKLRTKLRENFGEFSAIIQLLIDALGKAATFRINQMTMIKIDDAQIETTFGQTVINHQKIS